MTVRFENPRVKEHLKIYLSKLSSYNNFDEYMKLIVYSRASDDDFVAFEAVSYMLGFQSSAYKLSSILSSELHKTETTYREFAQYVNR